MDRYLGGEKIPSDDLTRAANHAIATGQLVPVVCVSTRKDIGVRELLDLVASCGLSPDDVHRFASKADSDEEVEIKPAEDGTLVAQVFRTTNDLFMGKLSYTASLRPDRFRYDSGQPAHR